MKSDAALGPDGFSVRFFRECWHFVSRVVMEALNEFHFHGVLGGRLNNVLISLIPKIPNPTDIFLFRPITVINSIYRILAKILANRLAKILPKIISQEQGAFVKCRLLVNGIAISSEVMDSLHKSNGGGICCKLDMAKAYDHVDWSFLDYMLGRMGFGPKWRGWIRECNSKTQCSIVINRKSHGFFSISWWLRQGDPLAPFLFSIPFEAFIKLLSKVVEVDLIHGVSIWARSLQAVPHSVNLNKSLVVGIKVQPTIVDEAAHLLKCQVGSLPFSYLGLPLRNGKPRKNDWNQAEMAMKQLESLSPPILKQVLPLVEQLPPLYMDLVKGREDFSPKPEETRRLIKSYYGISRNLLVKFKDDMIDETSTLAQVLSSESAISSVLDMSIRTLPGDHGLPLQQVLPDVPPAMADAVNRGGELLANLTVGTPWETVAREVGNSLGGTDSRGLRTQTVKDVELLADVITSWMVLNSGPKLLR